MIVSDNDCPWDLRKSTKQIKLTLYWLDFSSPWSTFSLYSLFSYLKSCITPRPVLPHQNFPLLLLYEHWSLPICPSEQQAIDRYFWPSNCRLRSTGLRNESILFQSGNIIVWPIIYVKDQKYSLSTLSLTSSTPRQPFGFLLTISVFGQSTQKMFYIRLLPST